MTKHGSWVRTPIAAVLTGIALVGVACGSTSRDSTAAPTTASPTATATKPPAAGAVSGLVDVGHGRKIFAKCEGTGSPAVVLIAGKGNGAEDWQQVLAPGDPTHAAPGDDVSVGEGKIVSSEDAVFGSVARFTRVCTYDRPDVRKDGADVSTPRAQPHPVDLDVEDLHALLGALGEPGPVVLVAHSYGGFIATLYARTYPSSVAGLVMVDPGSAEMANVVSRARLEDWDSSNAATSPEVREGVKLIDAIDQINASGPLPKVPSIVLSADKPWRTDLVPPEARSADAVTFDNWLASVGRFSTSLGAKHITQTASGHAIYLYSPQLVENAIREVVDKARHDDPTTTR